MGALLSVAGCLDGGGGSGGGGEIVGLWHALQDGCEQRLELGADGRFITGVVPAGGDGYPLPVHGRIAKQEPEGDGVRLRIEPDGALAADALIGCGQWRRRRLATVATDALVSAGLNPDALRPVAAVAEPLGAVRVWVDGSREAALVSGLLENRLVAVDPGDAPGAPFFVAFPDDPVHGMTSNSGFPVIDLPRGIYHQSLVANGSGTALVKLLLNVTATSRLTLTVSGADGTDSCRAIAYNATLDAPADPQPLNPLAAEQTIELHPFDPGLAFRTETVDGVTAYLWPLFVEDVAAGACTVTLRARSLAAQATVDLLADPATEPLIDVPFAAGRSLVRVTAGRHGERELRLPHRPLDLTAAAPDGGFGDLLAYPPVTAAPAGELDPFGLADGSTQAPLVRATDDTQPTLHVYSDPDAAVGLPPLVPYNAEGADETLSLGGGRSIAVGAGGPVRRLAVSLSAATRVDMWSQGGLDSYARLTDGAGWLLASDDDSAPDGVGFRIRRRLEPGEYVLHVGGRDAGTLDIFADVAPAPEVPDDALDHCLFENGYDPGAPDTLETLTCVGEGVRSLAGIGVADRLRTLVLSANGIVDLSPLASLTRLRTLSLAGNPVADVAALDGLNALHTLSLAHTLVTAEALTALAPLAEHLALLDLTGVPGLGGGALDAVQAALPETTILTAGGGVWP